MSWKYLDINGVRVLRKMFNDAKAEQEFMAMFPRKMEPGFVTVHQWQPGHTSTNRSEERYISAIDFYVAPVVDGKIKADLGQPGPGVPVPKAESISVPAELEAMNDLDLLSLAPQLGAKVNQRMPRPQILAACALAVGKNPRNWESVRTRLVENKLKREAMQPSKVTA